MKPIEFKDQNVIYAKDQPEYNPLPAHKSEDGIVTSCWQLDKEDLDEINKTGKIWLSQLTFNKPLQPVNIYTDVKFIDLNSIDDGKH